MIASVSVTTCRRPLLSVYPVYFADRPRFCHYSQSDNRKQQVILPFVHRPF